MTPDPPPSPTEPEQNPGKLRQLAEERASEILLGAFAILTTALTAFGVTSGTVDRVERNHSVLFWIGCVSVFAAICFGVIGLTVPSGHKYVYFRGNRWSYAALGCTFVGLVIIGFELWRSFWNDAYAIGGVLVAGGVALWVFGSVIKGRADEPPPPPGGPPRLEAEARNFFRAGAFAFLIGMGTVLAAIILQAREQPRPTITAKLMTVEGQESLETSIKASGLRGEEHLRLLMEGILPPHQGADGRVTFNKRTGAPQYYRVPLYFSVLGPNASGDIDYTVQAPLARRFDSIQVRAWVGDLADEPEDCFRRVEPKRDLPEDAKLPGCVTIRVPVRATLPVLALRWSARSKKPVLIVSLDAKDMPLTVPDVSIRQTVLARSTLMLVRAYGLASSSSSTDEDEELFVSLLSPDRAGTVTQSFRIAVPRRFTAVCVAAAPINPSDQARSTTAVSTKKPGCPEANASKITEVSAVWTYLTVPRQRKMAERED